MSSGTTLRGLILCNWGRTGKLFEEIMAQIFPNLISNNQTDPRSFKNKKHEENYTKYIISNHLKPVTKRIY